MNQVEVKRRQIEIGSCIIGLINILIFGSKLGNSGVAYLAIAMEAYGFFLTISSGCLADTLGKMLRSRIAKGQYKNSMCVRRRIFVFQGSIGVVCSVLLAAFSGVIAQQLFGVSHSTFVLLILSPALTLRAISAALIGSFQGEGTELPGAVAAPLRQLLIMLSGLFFVKTLGNYGTKVSMLLGDESYIAMYGCVGIAIAIVLAEVFVVIFLTVIALGSKKSARRREQEGRRQTDSFVNTLKILYSSMGMKLLLQIFELLPIWIGTVFCGKGTLDLPSFTESFGLLTGKFTVLCGFPAALIGVISVPMLNGVIGAYRREDYRGARNLFQCGLHMISAHGVFFTIFAAIMAEHLSGMVCGTDNAVLTGLLRCGSSLIALLPIYFFLSRYLMRMGRQYHLLGCLGLTNILFILVLSVLLNKGTAGVQALVYSAVTAVAFACVITGFLSLKLLHTGINWLRILAVPLGTGCVAGLLSMFLGKLFVPHLGYLVTVFSCLVLSFMLYWVILILFRSFQEQDLEHIPGGALIRAAGQTLRVFYSE